MRKDSTREWEIVFEATLDGVRRTRRTLIMIISLLCLGWFHLYIWYFSWEVARIAGREAGIDEIKRIHSENRIALQTKVEDVETIERWSREIEEISKRRESYELAASGIGLRISAVDFSIAIELAGVATLLWLIFNQRRVNSCLRRLSEISGWGAPLAILEFHFGLIGSHASGFMKSLGRLLPLGLPLLSLAFLLSDIFDLYEIWKTPAARLAFRSGSYLWFVGFRIGTGLCLFALVVSLGFWSYVEWKNTEEELFKYVVDEAGE